MFEKRLEEQIRKIFDFPKVTFDSPGESQEQEGVFIEIVKARTGAKPGRQIAHVVGVLHVFAASNKLPYGYFMKRIEAASAEDKRGFFFYNFEENKGKYRNIVERSVGFQYLFDSQYDPAVGRIQTVNTQISETET